MTWDKQASRKILDTIWQKYFAGKKRRKSRYQKLIDGEITPEQIARGIKRRGKKKLDRIPKT